MPTWTYEAAFSRHDGLISPEEQDRLRHGRVAIVGLGGVGGVHLITMARLGIGKFTIADMDTYDVSNINRQYGARVDTLGLPKTQVMVEEVHKINPEADVRVFPGGIRLDTVGEFLQDADVFVDGIDFFAFTLRRRLFREAAERGIFGVTAGPVGFGTAWITFDPKGMRFDDYFDLRDGQEEFDQLVCFVAGLAPSALHRPYMDMTKVDLLSRRGPSLGLACNFAAGIVATEVAKILLGRGKIHSAPVYCQFDAYRGIYRRRRMWGGNRNPLQRLKRVVIARVLQAGMRRRAAAGLVESTS